MMLQSGNEVKTSNRYVYFTDALNMIATYMHCDRQAQIIRSTETRNIEFDLIIRACRRDVIRHFGSSYCNNDLFYNFQSLSKNFEINISEQQFNGSLLKNTHFLKRNAGNNFHADYKP